MSQAQNVETRHEQRVGIAIFVIALILGAWLRFNEIEIKPFHHDEGVNSFFLLNLSRNGNYAYDPQNYHGPTLYYFAIPALRVLGETDLALRFWPAAFGLLTIGLLWWVRRELGNLGMAAGGLLIALSPGLVYFSRDFIHEMSFGFFTLMMVVTAWRWAKTRSFAALVGFSTALGFLFATKETALITIGVLAMALVSAAGFDIGRRLVREGRFNLLTLWRELWQELSPIAPSRDQATAALVIFLVINIVFYSSFFTNWKGVPDALRSLFLWSQRSGTEHVHSFGYYFGILFKLELPLLIGALVGAVVTVFKGNRFGLFVGAWTLGMFLAYSLIPYKTPWLMVNILIPLSILAGYAMAETYQFLPKISPRLLWALACVIAFVLALQMSWRVNFRDYDDNDNQSGYLTRLGKRLEWRPYTDTQYGYVYAQTQRDLLELVQAIKKEAARIPTGETTGILLGSPAYWPLPWYLRAFPNVAYTGTLPALSSARIAGIQPIVIANISQQHALEQAGGWRAATAPIALRPGEKLILYVRAN